jgi:hypothetical protein
MYIYRHNIYTFFLLHQNGSLMGSWCDPKCSHGCGRPSSWVENGGLAVAIKLPWRLTFFGPHGLMDSQILIHVLCIYLCVFYIWIFLSIYILYIFDFLIYIYIHIHILFRMHGLAAYVFIYVCFLILCCFFCSTGGCYCWSISICDSQGNLRCHALGKAWYRSMAAWGPFDMYSH